MLQQQTKDKYVSKIRELNKRFLIAACIVMFAALAIGSHILPRDSWGKDDRCSVYPEPIYQVFSNGQRKELTLPGRCEGERGQVMTMVTTLPDTIEEGTYLCFRSAKQHMKFYMDGKLIMEYDTSANRLTGRVDSLAYVFVPIAVEDAGKEVFFTTQTDSSYSGYVYRAYIGSQMGIWFHIISGNGIVFFVAVLLMILSVFFMITSAVLSYIYKQEVELIYLAGGIFIASLWELANGEFRQLFFPNLSIPNDLAFCAVMLLPLAFLQYINLLQKERYKRFLGIVSVLDILAFLPCIVLHVRKIVDYTDTIVLIDAMALLSLGAIVLTVILDVFSHKVREYRFVAIGLLVAVGFAVLQIVSYFRHINIFNGSVLELGLLFLLLCTSYHTFQDIRILEREQQKARVEAEAKGRFLANMSHEIRTPVNAILGLDTMILREAQDIDIKQYALDIQHAGQSLLSIINDILDFSKIKSGKLEIRPIEYDLSVLIQDVWNMIYLKAEDKGLELQFEVEEDLPLKLYGDDVRIRQVLINLLNNAVKYTEEGSVTLQLWCEPVRTDPYDTSFGQTDRFARLHFIVKDTGKGIREEDMDKLFAVFERIDEGNNRNIEGTGLGMSITTQLLEMMRSKLEIESEYGKGSAFSFVLTQKIMTEEPLGDWRSRGGQQATEYEYHASFIAPKAKILIVDDKEMNRRVLKQLLKEMYVQIEEAADGYECLEMTEKTTYDLIFLDHMMPGIDGCETLVRLREQEQNRDTYVVALTANAIVGVKEMFYEKGFNEYMSKPIDPDQLERLLFSALPKELIEETAKNRTKKTEEEIEEISEANLPEIYGINWILALYNLRDERLVRDTAEEFCRHGQKEWEELNQWYDAFASVSRQEYEEDPTPWKEALDRYRIQVHGMKSSAALIGATEVSELAKLLEFAAKDGRLDRIHMEMPLLKERWSDLTHALEVLLPQEEKKSFSPKAVVDYLTLLRLATEEGNTDMMDLVVRQLQEFALPAEKKEEFRALEQAVYDLDFATTKSVLARLQQWIAESTKDTF